MSEKTVLEVLQGALKLLQAKTRWTKGAYGKTGTGAPLSETQVSNYWKNRKDEECSPSGGLIVIWNDAKGRTHAQVVATFKKAIAAVKAAA